MRHKTTLTLLAVVALLTATLLLAIPSATAQTSVTYVAGNPTCQDRGYAFGFKPQVGENDFDSGTWDGYFPDGINTLHIVASGPYVTEWSSSLGIDAVIVKGGPGANVYEYNPEAFSGGNLSTPDAGPAVSHIEFCYDYELTGSKTANTAYTRTYSWTITKNFDGEYEKFIGDAPSVHGYTVSVGQSFVDSDWKVYGTITVNNPTPFTVNFSISDSVGGVAATIENCPATIAPWGSVTCDYHAFLGGAANGTNSATISSSTYGVNGTSASAGYTFGDPTNTVGYPTVNVTDTNGQAWSASGDATWNYTREFTCPTNTALYTDGVYVAPDHVNTATITETGQSDTATVKLTCYAPLVSKDAAASYNEVHTWDIDKTVTPESQSGFLGDNLPWTWTVNVSESSEDRDFLVTGTISVTNPAPMPMTVSLSDVLNDGTSATITGCDVDANLADGLTIPAGATATCGYTASPTDASATRNTATATLNGIPFSNYADFSFVKTVVNGTATVTDNEIGLDETLTAGNGPWEYTGPGSHVCSATKTDYVDNNNTSYSGSVKNVAIVSSGGEELDRDDATTAYTCYIPTITKTAAGSYDERHEWDVEKSVDPLTQNAFAGQTVPFTWTVVVTENVIPENFAVGGVITVVNPNPEDALVVALSDTLDDGSPVTITPDDDCAFDAVTGMLTVPAATTATCGYTASPTNASATKNTAVLTLNQVSFEAEAPFTFIPNIINGSVTLDDDQVPDWPIEISEGGTFTYDDSYTCSSSAMMYGETGTYSYTEDNTATLKETGDSDDATTEVVCYAPLVSKDANPFFTREWNWTIDKEGDQTELTLSPGQEPFIVNYDVTVSATFVDSGWGVASTIWVVNPAPVESGLAMPIQSIADVLETSPAPLGGTIDCGVTFPYNLPAGETLECTYTASLAGAFNGTNTASATLTTGASFNSAAVPWTFGGPTTEIDECVDLSDTKFGDLGTLCAGEGGSTLYEYSLDIRYDVCGEYEFVNVASFVTNDTNATGSDSWTVIVDVPCDTGCTLTIGYWKTHSIYGPAPYDDTWALIGEDTEFLESGLSYYEVLQLNAAGGNAWVILAQQYIAATLNGLNGADVSSISVQLSDAEYLLSKYSYESPPSNRVKEEKTDRLQMLYLATILDNYNNGLLGVPHCDF